MNVFFLGPPNTFSEKAAHALAATLSPPVALVAASSFEAVAQGVAQGEDGDAMGVLPYYNFLEGLVQESLDLIVEYRLRIGDACRLPISFAIGGWTHGENVIFSHPKGLAQCSDYLRAHFPDARLEPVASNAAAASLVAERGSGYAIAGAAALQNSGLPLVAHDITNQRHGKANFTEFLLLGRDDGQPHLAHPEAPMRTMVAIAPDFDEPGLLATILGQFAFHRLNIAKIHSRPLFLEAVDDTEPQMFYLEIMCALDSPALEFCVGSLRHRFGRVEAVRLLGQFPRLLQ